AKFESLLSYHNKLQAAATIVIEQQLKSSIYPLPCECGAIYDGETKIGVNR
ncbi:unnamed protein product, partial [Rotaria magnacalcarata]